MRTAEVIAHFKTQTAVAKRLGIRQASVAEWGEFPPDLRQLQLERITRNTLKAEPECKARLFGIPSKAPARTKKPRAVQG